MQGSLYTRDFLEEGIAETDAWKALADAQVDEFGARIRSLFAAFPVKGKPNEQQTEDDLIVPVLKALGWNDYLRQQATKRREDIPDILLFADEAHKAAANKERQEAKRYRHGLAIVESKAWHVILDRGPADLVSFAHIAPSTQMLRYLSRVEIESERAIRWGMLTNGRHWRLYFQGARSRSEEFLELDLPVLASVPEVPPDLFAPPPEQRRHYLKVFLLMLRRPAFLPGAEDRRSFHDIALDLTRQWEARVSTDLSKVVFDEVFPDLVNALARSDPKAPRARDETYLDEVRAAALILLYRLLFVLYAEDRNLLPAHEKGYDEYSLNRLRAEIRDKLNANVDFSEKADLLYQRLKATFRLIDEGESRIGLPPYNGGLFDPALHAILERARLPDSRLARIVDGLSRRRVGEQRKWINYRDLSVQHLGSIYESLLEYAVRADGERIVVSLNPFARKGSGSYYTHEDLVHLILERAVGPLIEERREAFRLAARQLAKQTTRKADRIEALRRFDPAAAILSLKICDPAMGSGHFLVSLVDYVADKVLESLDAAAHDADWAEGYVSPVAGLLDSIRNRILEKAERERWKIPPERLDDRHLVRRMILKRVVYGVDKNPMAVELAKVSLWLHTFTVGAPLSFLDHHLRCGDSLFGEWIGPVVSELKGAMLVRPYVIQAKNAARGMLMVEDAPDADITEVKASSHAFAEVAEDTGGLRGYLDLVHALRWMVPLESGEDREAEALLDGAHGDIVKLVTGAAPAPNKAAKALLDRAKRLAARERFLHWEVAFPGVWTEWDTMKPKGGFDAVIGNPPWDRMKLQEVEWFATRRPEIAKAARASDRKRMIAALKAKKDPLWDDHVAAGDRAERAARVARTCAYYPLLSGGDTNIYSLFVERARSLIKPDGIFGLLVPSGISSDKSASEFFKGVATGGHLAALFDFENRWPSYFPDVDSRFKFSVFVAGGPKRQFAEAMCAFFLNGVGKLEERAFALKAEDFARVNPNTGTAPMFRTKREAEIVRGIYGRLPVFVRHGSRGEEAVWPVRYFTMYHMTNDSGRFRTRAELEKDGFYPAAHGRMKRGEKECVPLMVGKSIHQFDHRAASASINEEALHVAASSDATTPAQHADPDYAPTPQFWVDAAEVRREWPKGLEWAIGFRDITNATNARTMIAAVVPFAAFNNKLPLLLPNRAKQESSVANYRNFAPLLLANLNAMAFDFVTRRKVQGTNLNYYIVEQLPVVPPHAFTGKLGKTTVGDFVRSEVLRLVYTANDLAAFARDQGYDGPPFAWDEEDRRHRRARLDALFFRLYGLDEGEADYVLGTFPIVKEQDEAAFGGRFRTRELVLAYMKALAAGDTETRVAL